jgi:hypothetical protein
VELAEYAEEAAGLFFKNNFMDHGSERSDLKEKGAT